MYEAQWLESRAALQQRQRALHAQKRALEHSLQRQQRQAALLRTVLQRAALLVIAWTSPETEPAELFLAQAKAKHDHAVVPTLECVLAEYMALSLVALSLLAAGGRGTPARALALARNFMRKCDVRTWIAEQNESKGLAPTTVLVQRRLLLHDRIYGPLRPHRRALSLSPVSSKWVQRFRRLWKLQRGAHQPRETLPQDVLLHRAPLGVQICFGV